MEDFGKTLIFAGITLILVGVIWTFAGKYVPLGKLPGDIVIDKPNFKAFFPITSMIVISAVASILYILYKLIFK